MPSAALFAALLLQSCSLPSGVPSHLPRRPSSHRPLARLVTRSKPYPGQTRRDPDGFAFALPGYHIRFPQDAGAHPNYRTEWWYYTGHLFAGGREYGFELTFFRVGLTPGISHRPSRWAASSIYLAHFAITDAARNEFHFQERADRGSLGLAGASTGRENVWIGDWYAHAPQLRGLQARGTIPGEGDPALWPHQLRASADFGSIQLVLIPTRPPAIQGRNGVSLKGPGPGQASHYYSYTRLAANGVLRIHGAALAVSGLAWMDHEFSTSALSADETGWDWFSIQLSDGWDLMLYQLRLAGKASQGAAEPDRAISPYSSGALIRPDGRTEFLSRGDFNALPRGRWISPHTGAVYPSGWDLHIPRAQLLLQETPVIPDQELLTTGTTGVAYWEGAMHVRGVHSGRPVTGSGYTELTGYSGALSQLR